MLNIKNLFDKKWTLDKNRGRSFMLYLIFIIISFIFWLLLTLNNEVQKDLFVNVNIRSIPDSTTIINDMPKAIRVTVRDKGSSLLRYNLGQEPSIDINFSDYTNGSGVFRITAVELKSVLRDAFGSGVNIINVAPDSLHIRYTNLPGKKVPVRIIAHATANLEYIINGAITQDIDSVEIFSDKTTLAQIHDLHTYRVEEEDLRDTLHRDVKIAPIKDVRIIPEKIKITIPVEPLITKHISIPIIARNVPADLNLVTFPSTVKLSFLVPLSKYKDTEHIEAIVFYNDIVAGNTKLKLNLGQVPQIYKGVSMAFSEVDYIIEKKN